MKKLIESDTLLGKFVNVNFNCYVEPQRKGTPKGEPIGLSRRKLWALLHMMYRLKQKEVAKFTKVSHGVVLKWRTENVFKKESVKYENMFLHIVEKFFKEIFDSYIIFITQPRTEYKKIRKVSIENQMSHKIEKAFGDFAIHSDSLMIGVYKILDKVTWTYALKNTAYFQITRVIRETLFSLVDKAKFDKPIYEYPKDGFEIEIRFARNRLEKFGKAIELMNCEQTAYFLAKGILDNKFRKKKGCKNLAEAVIKNYESKKKRV